MIISDVAVKKSTSVVVLAFILIVFGVYCYMALPRENDPEVVIPNVFISTSYRGVSSRDIETAITVEIEKKLKGLDGLKKLSSVSAEGLSSINAEFVTGTDIDQALIDVKDKVDEAMGELPADLEEDPLVFEVNFSEMPIIVYSLSGTCGLSCLKDLADDLKDELEGIRGVLEVEVSGGLEREIRVEVFPEKLAYYGLSIDVLRQTVKSENQNTSGGNIQLGNGRFQLRVPGEFAVPEEIYGLIVGTHQGQPVYLKDVARVVDDFKEETSRSRLDGKSAVNISVKKRAGENIVSISREAEKVLAEEQKNWPADTRVTKVLDKAKDVRLMVEDLENNILSGLVLVLIVIFFVMGMRNALLVSLAIPFSMLITFTVLYVMGITLNMVVLFSLTLALGMLVDNAIVIVENIYRFMEQGLARKEAAMRATSEVAYPVIGSTLTTVAAFAPMLFWPGIMGEFMGYLPLTLMVTLASSLFVALVINPAIASIFMKVKTAGNSQQNKRDVTIGVEEPAKIKGWLLSQYARMLTAALDKPVSVVLLAFCVLIIMFQGWRLVIGLEKPVEFMPDVDPKGLYVNIDMPEGADLDYVDRIVGRVEEALFGGSDNGDGPSDMTNIESIYSACTIESSAASAFSLNTPNHVGVRFVDMVDRGHSTKLDVDEIRERVKDIPGGEITVTTQVEGPPTGFPINIEIAGDDFLVLGRIAREIKNFLGNIPHVKDVQDDFVEGIPSVQVVVDRQRAALFGLTTDAVGYALKSAYNGLEVSSFRERDDDYDITVQLQESDRQVVDILNELMMPTPSGQMVPLSTIADIKFSGVIGDITRINHQRVVTVRANVDETKVPGPVARAEAAKLLEEYSLPPGYSLKFTGEFEFQEESEAFLSKAFVVALLFIFLILVSMFNSVVQPFIIMTSVMLSLGGVFLGLTLFQSSFGIIMTGVGVISLAGVVVNNAIVLIDYTNKLVERGYELQEAVIAAGATRLRPVLLTAVTTILGLIPMVTGVSFDFHTWSISWTSEASQWWRSMAVVVIFGLVVATFLTLVVVPTLFYMLGDLKNFTRRMKAQIYNMYWYPYNRFFGGKVPLREIRRK